MVGAVVWLQNKPDPQDKPTRGINQVDYSGPTSAEKDAGNDQKQAVIQRDTVDSGSTPSKANIVLVDSSQYDDVFEIRGYVSNLFENDGFCTATLTKAGYNSVTKKVSASSSATNTQCQTVDIPVTEFPAKGPWQLTVSYSSAHASGATPVKAVTIQ
jgi:hypothetical protein